MKFLTNLALAALMILAAPAAALAAPQIGAPAPGFTAADSNGDSVSLSDFAGRTVVLEWTNDGCPFVRKHYGSGNMQQLQREAADAGVVWLSVISSAPGKQGYADGTRANELTASREAAPAHVLLDPEGSIGRLYGATATPHMFVIDGNGALAYMGAIDDRPSPNPASLQGARNYVREALASLASGQPVAEPVTQAYGCAVKYGG
jgi:peroxiredoxin